MKVRRYLSGLDFKSSHAAGFWIKSITPAESAFVVVSDPPTKVSAIISACSSLSVRVRPHSGITRLTSSDRSVSSGSRLRRSKIGWK